MGLWIEDALIGVQSEDAPAGGEGDGFDALDELLALEAVADEVCDGAHPEVVLLAEQFELGTAHHLAIFADDFAAEADGLETGESAEVDDGFGVTGADEDAALFGAERDHVTGAGEVFGAGPVVA